MVGVSRRKKQMRESAKKAGIIKIEKNVKKNSSFSKSSVQNAKRNSTIIAAASNLQTKSSSNPFSKLMKVYKDNKLLKKAIQKERLRRANDVKRRKKELRVQKEQAFQHNFDKDEGAEVTYANEDDIDIDYYEDDEIMQVEQPSVLITPEPHAIVETNVGVSPNYHGATSKNDEEILFVPRKNTKFIKKRSVFNRIRKLRQLAQELTDGAAYVNTPNQRKPAPLDKQAELLFQRKLKARQVDHLSKLTGKCFTYKTLMKKLKPVLDKFPIVQTPDDKLMVSLIESLKQRLKNMVHKLPKNKRIRVTVVADKGECITKICYFFNDVQKPQVTENLGVLCFYIGDDDSNSIKAVCEALNKEIEELLEDGIIIDKTRYDFEFFITGDCKSICSMLGVQGCNAKKFCHHCLSDDYCNLGEIRTVESITMDAKSITEEVEKLKASKKKLSDYKIRLIKQKFNSVSHQPFFKKINHMHIVTPALHLLMALANKLIEYFKHSRLSKIIQDLKVEPIKGRTEYNGNSCRKILQYFREHKPESIDELQMFHLFKQAAHLQSFAVARKLSADEIKNCEYAIQRLFDDLDGLSKFKYTNKLHILRFHVIPFIHSHGSWGIFSEQSIERLHCLVNEYRKRISSKNDLKKNIYAMQMLVLGTFFHDLK